jgi:crotonobetainyl-CoA:carnitine CoA-transferase CaiB-like acyl-CoA transferase
LKDPLEYRERVFDFSQRRCKVDTLIAGKVHSSPAAIYSVQGAFGNQAIERPVGGQRFMLPLQGIRVLDLTRAMAGPYCTMILGDLGADVIKVERPGSGDESRGWGPPFVGRPYGERPGESGYFISANRNKRSITLNLKSEKGQGIIRQLATRSDALVENFRTGVLEKMGLGYDDLQTVNQRLIYCSISGYGRTGPYSEKAGYDVIVQAEGGMMGITGPKEGPPFRVGVPIVDITSGMFAAIAILAALRSAESSGQGQHLDISLFDSQAALLTNVAANYLVGNLGHRRLGNAHPNLTPYEVFPADDGWFVLGVGNERQWKILCERIERPALTTDSRFKTNEDRIKNRGELIPILNQIFSGREIQHWLTELGDAGLPCGPINTVETVFDHPQRNARELILEVQHPTAGNLQLPGFPYKLSDTPAQLRFPPPTLGEHTEQVLQDLLDLSTSDIQGLRQEAVI